jgi:hypothetical protein
MPEERAIAPIQEPAQDESEDAWRERIGKEPDLRNIVALLRRAAMAQHRLADLMQLVSAQIPQWERHPKMGMADALRRWWPAGGSTTPSEGRKQCEPR